MLPQLSRIYGLKWADLYEMPQSERDAYLDDLHRLMNQG